jgi:hypothetical protein
MRALFVTSETNDVDSLVQAWDCWQPDKSEWVTFHHMGENNDDEIMATAQRLKPDIIFYIGANEGIGIPSDETLVALRKIAPSVNLCCDAADWPWHEPLKRYKKIDAFDLQVALDGNHTAPVDFVTVTPVDPAPFAEVVPRTIHCGFSGGVAPQNCFVFQHRTNPRPTNALPAWTKPSRQRKTRLAMSPAIRDQVIWDTGDVITVRERRLTGAYKEHADFMLSCHMIINVSATGSGDAYHIKGRVMETGWAGCALLELQGSPIAEWLPPGSYFLYKDAPDAQQLIESLTPERAAKSAAILSRHVRENYHPRQIYGEILERAGLVDHSIAIPTT